VQYTGTCVDCSKFTGFLTVHGLMAEEERAGRSKIDRISLHSKEIVKNFQGWVDLRFQLIGLQYWESVLRNRKTIYIAITAGYAFAIAITFLLIAVALGLGILLRNPIWGFALTGGIMALVAWILFRLMTRSQTRNNGKINRIISETNGRKESEPSE